ncbi:glycosyl hydrolase [Motiliproteus coralliicola]|uniref:Glycosyl hydrolase n=1 Tax=Motiliproteus coralliicola TaxID=2283196 RepID=A0A369WZP2_9GAMM|nr:YCF48-related protein [Motiliproteus coralliicola]RDE24995.1 glycosyl hydrolase [Motiliproteus coralliicola]
MFLSLLPPFRLSLQKAASGRSDLSVLISTLVTVLLLSVGSAQAGFDDRMMRPAEVIANPERSLLVDLIGSDERLLAIGERGRVLISDDLGLSWRQGAVPVSVMLTGIAQADESSFWVVGHDGIVIRSEDRGENWTKVLEGRKIVELVAEYYRALVAEAEADPDYPEFELEELMFRAEEAELAVEDQALPTLLNVAFVDARHGYLLGAYGLLLETRDGGESWTPINEALGNIDGFHLNALTVTDSALYIAGEAGSLFRSLDRGQSWEALPSPYDGSFFGLQPLNQDSLVAYGLRGNAFESRDGGDSWQPLPLPIKRTLTGMAQLENGTQILVGSFGALLVKTAGSEQFIPQPLPLPAPSMAVLPVTEDQVVVVGLAGVQRVVIKPVAAKAAK